jgi:hypothetical protein
VKVSTLCGEFNPFSETKGFFSNFFRSGGVFATFSAAGKSSEDELKQ